MNSCSDIVYHQNLLLQSPFVSVYRAESQTPSQPVTKETDEELLYIHTHSLPYTYPTVHCSLSLSYSLLARPRCSYDNGSPFQHSPPPASTSSVSKSQGVCLSWRLSVCLQRRVTATKTGVREQPERSGAMMSSVSSRT